MERRAFQPFERLSTYVASLRPGDKALAAALALITVLASVVLLFAVSRALMVEQPAYGGSLTEGVVGNPRFINPLLAISDADRDLTALTYAGLMGLDADGTVVPVLAEGYTVSEDGKEYTFTLRASAQFSDGSPVTAEDVVFTIERAQDPALKSPELANWANIRAEVVDARTVRFTLPKPYAPFLVDTTLGILPAHLWRNIPADEFPFSPLMEVPVGAGPFKVTNVTRTKEGRIVSYALTAFHGYAPGRAYLNHITLRFFETQEKLAQALSVGAVESAYGMPGTHTLRVPYTRIFGVFFNQDQNPVFARLEVRKALSIAIDRTKITNDIMGGYATALMGPLPPGNDDAELTLPEDRLGAARTVLTDAGWTFDEETQVWSNVKQKLTLPQVTIKTSNVPELKTLAGVVESDWEALGVPTQIELYEPGDLAATVIRPRAYEALLFGMVVGHDRDLFAFWDSGERSDPGLNIAAYANRSVDELLASARSDTNPAQAEKDLMRAAQLIAEDYPAAFTHAPDFLYAIPNSLYGVRLPQIASPSDRFASVADWYREREYVWPFLAR